MSQDAFFYSLVYDPQQKTLLADKGEIRVGQRYQAEVKVPLLKEGRSLMSRLVTSFTFVVDLQYGVGSFHVRSTGFFSGAFTPTES